MRNGQKGVTMREIALRAGVTVDAVSKALRDRNDISEKKKEEIRKIAEELGYVPNHNARSLSTGKSHLIGLFLPLSDTSVAFLQNPFYVEYIGGLEKGIMDATLALLSAMPNVIITSHQAFLTEEALSNIAKVTFDNMDAFFAGKELVNEVVYSTNG